MEVVRDALNSIALRLQRAKQISVRNMEAEDDALNRIVRRVPEPKQINV
jgi:hypothetical protein